MISNQTTELLREGLTEHGIEWRSGLEGVTFVGDWCFVEYDNGKLAATCEPVLTPEQAIAATLGNDHRTTELLEDLLLELMDEYAMDDFTPQTKFAKKYVKRIEQAVAATMGSDEPPYDVLLRCLENDWHISASWDGLRKFWCIELTEEGVRMRDTERHAYEQRITGDGSDWGEIMRDAYDDLIANACESCTPEQMRQLADHIRAELWSGTCEMVTSGTLTAEQVRKAIFDCSTYASYDGCTYHASGIRPQAIADELNDERDELKVRISELEKQWDARDSDCIALEAKVNRLEDEITDWSELYAQVLSERNHVIAKRDEWKTKCETREFAYKQADAERKRYSEQIDELRAERDEWKAKLANLNAELGSGTCKLEPLSALDVTLNMLGQTEWGACSECGCAVPMDARFCNECGKVVKQ